MANRFWVLGTGNTSDTAHWAATTGGAGGETVPVAGDTVNFDSNSGTAATVTVDVALSAASITINKSDLTLLHNAGTTLTGAMTLTAGTLNTNWQTCSWGSFSAPSGTKTVTLGASAITITGTGVAWNFGTAASGIILNANTSTITLTGASITFTSGGNGINYNNVVFSGAGNAQTTQGYPLACVNFTRTGTAVKTDALSLGQGITCTGGTCTLGGNTTQGVNRLLVQSNTVGTSRTITAAAYVITGDVDFMDMNLAYSGAASWTNTGSAYIGDALGNAGAVTTNATVSATQTATGTASFTWSTHGWTTRVPLPQDDVVINNAFVAGRTATMDMPRAGRDLTFSCTGNPTWSMNPAQAYGSLTLASGMLTSGYNGGTLSLWGRSTHTITTNLVAVNFPLQVNGAGALVGGKYTLQDNLNIPTLNFSVRGSGSLDANNKDVICGSFDANTNTTHIVAMGSGTWTLAGQSCNANIWIVNASGMTLTGSAIINITYNGASAMNFVGAGLSYGTLRHTATGSAA